MANGAFEDAFIPTARLDEQRDDPVAALQSYEAMRAGRY
jgi:hypothetical protein